MTGVRSEKRIIRRFSHRANVVERTYTTLDGLAHRTRGLHGTARGSQATSLHGMSLLKTRD